MLLIRELKRFFKGKKCSQCQRKFLRIGAHKCPDGYVIIPHEVPPNTDIPGPESSR